MTKTEQQTIIKNYKPLVIVMGRSGFGKSTSMRNLDSKSTIVFNTELKPLPFKGSGKFKNIYLENQADLINYIAKAQDKEDIKTIVIDSFTGWTESLMSECRAKYRGYDVYNNYNDLIGKFFKVVKKSTKQIFLIGHEDVTTLEDGSSIIGLKVEGQVWRGVCEKEAVVVLHATMESDGKGNNNYFFETQSNGTTNAKSPVDMFKNFKIDNDLNLVSEALNNFYN
jgi:hypothetical protein